MGWGTAFAGLLVLAVAGAAAVQLARGEDERRALSQARNAIGGAADVTLERAADYWLASAERKRDGNALGSSAALAVAIRLGRAEAMRGSLKKVPSRMKQAFRAHYPDEVLDEARWTVAEPGTRLARVLARWPVKEGAVTLGNVIVFKTERGSKNHSLFAHELEHVDQYRKLGIEGFARRYAEKPEPIEAEARAKARRVTGRG